MAAVADRIKRRVLRDFAEDSTQVLNVLVDIPESLPGTPQDSERIHGALLLSAHGNLRRFDELVALARLDWRDLLVGAQLADADWHERLNLELG